MIAAPKLTVLTEDHRSVELTPRSEPLLEELARRLQLPDQIALQVALTHTLASVQRLEDLHLVLPFELEAGHKPDPDRG